MKPSELQRRREAANVSRKTLAAAAGINQQTVWLFEAGRMQLKEETLAKLTAAYDRLGELETKRHAGGRPGRKKRRDTSERPPKVKPKRRYIRKPKANDPGDDCDAGLDDCMKNSTHRDRGRKKAAAPPAEPPGPAVIDRAYLLAQLESWKKNGARTVTIGIPGQPEHSPQTFIIATESQICEYGRLIALRCGKNPE